MIDTDLPEAFAELAPRFGFSRPAGRCLGAIWRAAQAPSADDLVEQLSLSRSNVSTALKELREAGLVQAARSPGSRKDFFVAPTDAWELARLMIAERERRVIGPARDQLSALEARSADPRAAALCEVLDAVSGFLQTLTRLDPTELARQIDPARGSAKAAKSGSGGGKKKKKKAAQS
ncbi:GbsR/MarR family transcriptional regulator [Thioclava atlantica]|uniref:MarR family transcriptional regulator n=1 Tax=Thioclava atlantica TaxID=1317124 RepID=A0A085U1U1_9RHOB|nr:MarR family transcriptional regulator [Thioclava atlantica]KFE36938.1 MarR family transcriptional regulator [Thioclava atlantica]